MFCPKCGAEAAEGQKFCKSCGTNIQAVSDAIAGAEDPLGLGKLRVDVDSLKTNAVEWARQIKAEMKGETATRRIRRETREAARRTPRPREWLRYSWQHNLRDGLINVMAGAGFAGVWYILGRAAIDAGAIGDLEAQAHVQGLAKVVSLLWLLGGIRVLKGLGQIVYAAFFADPIATLTERFLPPPVVQQPPALQPSAVSTNELIPEPPPSVTEHTTHILEDAPRIGATGQGSSAQGV
ncbi:MAG TPA: zinc ribbon domain-containing protein [Blastocatellia bacterium]|nr:zinc ribbon domain-containing protein [Blastocatellia bacterium]